MAQKRNPVSLRLQTRLQGHEKRFASCWFTDYFFSQMYANDLVNRLYLGHLLQKVGSWYGERNESCIPETCVSVQFVYRRCLMFSIVLDARKEEYALSNPSPSKVGRPRQERGSVSFQQDNQISNHDNKSKTSEIVFNLNDENAFFLRDEKATKQYTISQKNKPLNSLQNTCNTALLSSCTEKDLLIDKINYLYIANSFGGIAAKYERHVFDFSKRLDLYYTKNQTRSKNQSEAHFASSSMGQGKDKAVKDASIKALLGFQKLALEQTKKKKLSGGDDKMKPANRYAFSNQSDVQNRWKDWFDHTVSCQYRVIPDFESVSTIESICDISQKKKLRQNKPPTCLIKNQKVENSIERSPLVLERDAKHAISINMGNEEMLTSFVPASHWTSLSFIRGVSAYQSVEFCLHFVCFLYKKRFSFLQIKEILFRMLETNQAVRGARLVCSGRQGGRSKSAMRAKKQSALWGQTALSLFSSRLAFASTSVETSFGQIGIKVWICYK